MSFACLELETASGPVAIPARLARRIELIDEVHPVPGAPLPLLGIAEASGGIVTLLDPAHWGGDAALCGSRPDLERRAMLVLAPPFENLALALESPGALERVSASDAPLVDAAGLSRVLRALQEAP